MSAFAECGDSDSAAAVIFDCLDVTSLHNLQSICRAFSSYHSPVPLLDFRSIRRFRLAKRSKQVRRRPSLAIECSLAPGDI